MYSSWFNQEPGCSDERVVVRCCCECECGGQARDHTCHLVQSRGMRWEENGRRRRPVVRVKVEVIESKIARMLRDERCWVCGMG